MNLSQKLQLQLKESSHLKHQENNLSALAQNLQKENLDLSQKLQFQLKEASYLKRQENNLSALVQKLKKENLDLSQTLQLQMEESSNLSLPKDNLSAQVHKLQKEKQDLHTMRKQLEEQKRDLKFQIEHMKREADINNSHVFELEKANVDYRDNIMTLVAQRENLNHKISELEYSSQLRGFSYKSEMKDWRELLKRNSDLQAEYSQEFVALVEKLLELFQRQSEESDQLHLEELEVIEVIEAKTLEFNRQYPRIRNVISNPSAWNEHVRYLERRNKAADHVEKENKQLLQVLSSKRKLRLGNFMADLQNVADEFNKLQLRFNFLMRLISSEVEPKENLDQLFGKLCEVEAVREFVNEKDEWKKKCMVLTSVIVLMLSFGFVYVPMPMMMVLSIVIIAITILCFLFNP